MPKDRKTKKKPRAATAETILEAMVDGVCVCDSQGSIIQANKALAKIHGYDSVDELLGKKVTFIVPKRQVPAGMEAMKECFKKGILRNFESIGLRKDGTEFLTWLNATILRDPSGKVVGTIAVLRDVTELKKAQEQVQETIALKAAAKEAEAGRKKLETQIEAMVDGVVVIDINGNIVQGNKAYAKMHGYKSMKQIIGKNITTFVLKTEIPRIGFAMKECMKKGVYRSFETIGVTKQGKKLPILVSGRVLKDAKGRPTSIIAVLRDITERKRMEETLKERVKELNAFYGLSKAVERPQISLKEIYHELTRIIPLAWQYPDITCVRISIDDKEYTTKNFKKTKWKLSAKVGKLGVIEVYYLKKKPFSEEERKLLEALAERLKRIIEHKRAEKELRKKAVIICSTSDAIITTDLKGNITFYNKAAELMYGYTVKEMIGKPVAVLYPKQEFSKLEEIIKDLLKGKRIPNIEVTVKCKNKKLMPVVISLTQVRDEKGKIIEFVGLAKDITERKKAEERLEESEARYKLLLEASEASINLLDKDGNFLIANRYAAEAWGMTPEELINKNIRDVMPPVMASEAMGLIRKVEETAAGTEQERFIESLGKYFIENIQPVKNQSGEFIGVQVMAYDITERKRAERGLREERNKLQKYLDIAGIIVLVLDTNQKVLLINKKGCEILERKAGEIINKNWIVKFIPKRNRAEVGIIFEKLMNEKVKEIEYFEKPILTKSGKERIIVWHNTPLKDEAGRVQAILSVGTDVTELKRAKTTIEQLRELDKMKDDFLNIAAHELKTPLTSIVGLSEIIKGQDHSLGARHEKYVDIIHEEGNRLSHIVERILTVTRYESGKETVYIEPFNLTSFVSSLLPNLNMLAKKKRSRIVISPEKKSIVIRSDKEKVSQMIYNLVDNAVKYGPEGQIITISITKPRGNQVKIAVTDQGKGIPQALQKTLFVKFSQLGFSFARKQEGTGLGLYICKLIVDKLGGKIGVKSSLGKGSTFYFALPIRAIRK